MTITLAGLAIRPPLSVYRQSLVRSFRLRIVKGSHAVTEESAKKFAEFVIANNLNSHSFDVDVLSEPETQRIERAFRDLGCTVVRGDGTLLHVIRTSGSAHSK
jgi:hypothetical protein